LRRLRSSLAFGIPLPCAFSPLVLVSVFHEDLHLVGGFGSMQTKRAPRFELGPRPWKCPMSERSVSLRAVRRT
ncbi:hypothetical protein EDB84DRAFT_1528652, partial [Lactarius hengduanensis]